MFKSDLDGLYHREQIRDYIREVEHSSHAMPAGRRDRRNIGIKLVLVVGTITLLASMANLGQIAMLLHMIK